MTATLNRPPHRRWRWLIPTLILMGLGSGLWIWRQGRSEEMPIPVQRVEQGTVEQTLNESGTLELGNQQTLTAPADGVTVDKVWVTVGDRVEPGDILVTLRNPGQLTLLANHDLEMEKQQTGLEQARLKVREAEVAVEDLGFELQKRQLSVTDAERSLAQAEYTLANERTQLQDVQELFDLGFAAGDDLSSQRNRVQSATFSYQEAQTRLASIKLDLEQHRLKFQRAQEALDQIQTDAQIALQQAELNLAQLQLRRREILGKLEESRIMSPSGRIILDITVQPGDVATLESDLVTVGNPDQEVVQLNLSLLSAPKVKLGQEARVTVIGPNPEIYTGELVELSRIVGASTSSRGRDSGQLQISAQVRLSEPSRTLIPGTLVNVELILNQATDVVQIPLEAVQDREGDPFVWVVNAQDQAERRSIELGLEGLTMVEVTEGLAADEILILEAGEITDNQRVNYDPSILVPDEDEAGSDAEAKDRDELGFMATSHH